MKIFTETEAKERYEIFKLSYKFNNTEKEEDIIPFSAWKKRFNIIISDKHLFRQ